MQTYMKPRSSRRSEHSPPTGRWDAAAGTGCPAGLGSPGTQPARGILAVAAGDYQAWLLFPQVKSVCVKRKCKPYTKVQREGMNKNHWRASCHVRGCWSAIMPSSFPIVTFAKQLFCFENKPERAWVWPRKVYPMTKRIHFYMQIRKPFSIQVVKDNTTYRAHEAY